MVATPRPTLAKYHLLGRLGSGGMGDVWLARAAGPAGFEKLVAVKTIKTADGANDPLTKMFLLEARVAALLAHPNCVQVFELGEENGVYFIAMEYIDGFSLGRVLRRARDHDVILPVPIVARIIVDAAIGLEYAHALKDTSGQPLGLVHRDVSLENVLVTFAGQTKLVDFGIAKLNAVTGERTETGTVKGKYAYMAPEYLRGEAIDGRVDVFALGVVTYRALAKEKPFVGESDAQIIAQLLSPAPAPRLSRTSSRISDPLDDVIAKALEKHPDHRFDGARAFRTALAAAVPDLADADGVAAVMESLWREGDPERELPRRMLAAGTEAQTTPLSVPVRLSTSAETTPAAFVTTIDAAPRPRRWRWIAGAAITAAASAGAVMWWTTRGGETPAGPAPTQLAPAPVAERAAPAASADGHKRVAVLPFETDAAAPAPDFVPPGLRDALVGKLAHLDSVTVAAAKATTAAAGDSPSKLGRELGVATIVRATVAMKHDRLEVDLAIVDAASEQQTFAHHYSGGLADLLTVDDRIARDIVAAIGVTPTGAERAHLEAHPTDKADAYELYLQAHRKASTLSDAQAQEAALGLYAQALALDPSFALAYAGLAESQVRMFVQTKAPIWATRARSAAEQAVRLDDQLADTHDALGFVLKSTGHVKEALAEYGVAVKLAPSQDEGYRHLGNVYMDTGREPEAIAAFEHAIELNPYYWANYAACATAYQRAGEIDRSEDRAKKAVELAPDNTMAMNTLALAYSLRGDHEHAAVMFEKAIAIHPVPELYGNLGTSYGSLGRFAEAKVAFEHAAALAPTEPMFAGAVADGHLWAGDSDAKLLYAKAIAMANEALASNPKDASLRASLATWYAKSGSPAKAKKVIASARAIDPTDVELRYTEVVVSAWSHQRDDAFKQLEAALAAGYRASNISRDPDLAPLRADPRFAALAAKYRTATK